jgi:hypothetical protein
MGALPVEYLKSWVRWSGVRNAITLAILFATRIGHAVDPDPNKRVACQLPLHDAASPGCRAIDSVRTRWGIATLFAAYDRRTLPLTAASKKAGEYLVVYSLTLPGEPAPETFEVGGQPSAHHYEECGSQSDWCEQIASSIPRLSIDKTGAVTLVVTTITHAQHWVEAGAKPPRVAVDRTRHRHTLHCRHAADGAWTCDATDD